MHFHSSFLKKQTITVSLVACSLFSTLPLHNLNASSIDMSLLVRRITEFWKEGDYKTAKLQIIDFVRLFPDSEFSDQLNAMLGDLYYQENEFDQAIATYQKIKKPELQKKIFINFLQCYYELKQYGNVIDLGSTFLNDLRQEDILVEKARFIFAESASELARTATQVEEKKKFASLAKPYHQILLHSRYKEYCLSSLAESYQILEEFEESAKAYQQLITFFPEKTEEILFQIADLETHYNIDRSIDTLSHICQLNGEKKQAAAYNKMVLLFNSKKYNKLISQKEELHNALSEAQVPLLDFFVGKSYYTLQEYDKASPSLLSFVNSSYPKDDQLKNALVCLSLCSCKSEDLASLENALAKMKENFPHDPDYAQMLIVYSSLCNQMNLLDKAEKSIEETLVTFPHHAEHEKLLYDYALVLYKKGAFHEGRQTFAKYLNAYPDGQRAVLAWKHFLNCSIKDAQGATETDKKMKKEQCVSDLTTILDQRELLSDVERSKYQFYLAKNLYEIKDYTNAIIQANRIVESDPYHENIAEIYLLMAMAKLEAFSDFEGFVKNAEKALSYKKHLPEEHLIHLHLYNAYIQLKDGCGEAKEKEYEELAALHLLECFYANPSSLNRNNLLYLANYYLEQFQEYKKRNPDLQFALANQQVPYLEQAIDLYKEMFKTADGQPLAIQENDLFVEEEILKFAELLEIKSDLVAKQSYLTKLIEAQKSHPDYDWKFQRHIQFELGKTCESLGQTDAAIQAYDDLIQSSSHVSSFHANAALLHRNRLKMGMIKDNELNENNLQVLSILNSLKDLQIRKKLHSEPLHLEAALDYIDLKSKLVPKEERGNFAYKLYQNLREDFSSENDPNSADYQSARSHFPEKSRILNDYLQYVQMKMYFLEAKKEEKNNSIELVKHLNKKGSAILSELQDKIDTLPTYLQKRIQTLVQGNDITL